VLSGSSPRTWGTLRRHRDHRRRDRFIPTYMGNANRGRGMTGKNSVHPHVHGERSPCLVRLKVSFGSSPRTWGTRINDRDLRVSERFIPTYMGNASPGCGSTGTSTVHPHVHGERVNPRNGPLPAGGSSPRTWGTRVTSLYTRYTRRFIPTYMGNAEPADE